MARRLAEHTTANARSFRRAATDAEARLWSHLRRQGLGGCKFRRQHPFGPYILDFHCAQARFVLEVDGGQHVEAEHVLRDMDRTRYLEGRGLRVLRFNNMEVMLETDAVLGVILKALADPSP